MERGCTADPVHCRNVLCYKDDRQGKHFGGFVSSSLSADLRKDRSRTRGLFPSPNMQVLMVHSLRLDATDRATHHTHAARPTNDNKTE